MNIRKERLSVAYDIIFSIIALIAVYLAIYDIAVGCTKPQHYLDIAINILFICDYGIRLLLAKNKKGFVKNNIFDLIAIIPFNSLFKVFRVFKIFKFLRLLKIIKVTAYFARLYKRVKLFFEINGLKYMVIATVICVIFGGIAIHFAEGMSITDGLWWSFVTATTVGYGDISPTTIPGRIVATVLMIVGIGLIGSLTSTITALFFQRASDGKAHSARDEILKSIQNQLDDFDSLTDNDLDTICNTLRALHTNKK